MFSDNDEPSKIMAGEANSSFEGTDFLKEVVAMTAQENSQGFLNEPKATEEGLETNFMKVCDDLQREQSELEA
jgi:hypothetical protein